MGLFDLLDEGIDALVDLPGRTVKVATEAVARTPEMVAKTAKGVKDGLEEAVEKLEEMIDDD